MLLERPCFFVVTIHKHSQAKPSPSKYLLAHSSSCIAQFYQQHHKNLDRATYRSSKIKHTSHIHNGTIKEHTPHISPPRRLDTTHICSTTTTRERQYCNATPYLRHLRNSRTSLVDTSSILSLRMGLARLVRNTSRSISTSIGHRNISRRSRRLYVSSLSSFSRNLEGLSMVVKRSLQQPLHSLHIHDRQQRSHHRNAGSRYVTAK